MTDERHRDQHAGDAAIDAAWRGASRDVPSAQVDAAILAAARAEVRRPAAGRRAPVRQAWWHAWQPLAAAAGVAGLAFVLVQVLPREPGVRAPQVDSAVPEASAPQAGSAIPAASAPQVGSAAPRDDALRTDRGEAQPGAEVAISAEAIAGAAADADAAVASVPAPASAPAPAAELRSDQRQESAPAERSAMADAAPPAAKHSAAAEPAPEQWARYIAALYEAGDVAAAAAELRAFRQAYPDADDRLAPALRGWAASVHPADAP